jgi:hypothetical protein
VRLSLWKAAVVVVQVEKVFEKEQPPVHNVQRTGLCHAHAAHPLAAHNLLCQSLYAYNMREGQNASISPTKIWYAFTHGVDEIPPFNFRQLSHGIVTIMSGMEEMSLPSSTRLNQDSVTNTTDIEEITLLKFQLGLIQSVFLCSG